MIIVLMYHRVVAEMKGQINFDPYYTSLANFEKHIEYLINSKYKFLSQDDFLQILRGRDKHGSNKVLLTFDDGSIDNYLYVFPLLKRHKIPALFFLATGYIGTRKMFWWNKLEYALRNTKKNKITIRINNNMIDFSVETIGQKRKAYSLLSEYYILNSGVQDPPIEKICTALDENSYAANSVLDWEKIKEMAEEGISFGAHTVNHVNLNKIDYESSQNEMKKSKETIESSVGQEVKAFAYPYGIYSKRHISYLKSLGIQAAFTAREGIINGRYDRYMLNRIGVEDDNILRLNEKLSKPYTLSNNPGMLNRIFTKGKKMFLFR